jgi:hypothetical protein
MMDEEERKFMEWWATLSEEEKARGLATLKALSDAPVYDLTKQGPDQRRAALQTLLDRPKCEHVYNPLRSLDGSTKGTLTLDRYKDEALNRPDQYRCVKCNRIMRRSQRGRLYYLRCDMHVDGEKCEKPATFIAFDHTQHRRVWIGQLPYAFCDEHALKPEEPKPKAARRTILRKKAKK